MIRARQPCRQLNSEAIKSNAMCFLSPVVSGKCSIVCAKCICNVKDKALKRSWEAICAARDACDTAISGIQDAAFFFSAISTHAKSKAKVSEENEEESEESDEDSSSQIPSTTTQQWIDGHPALVNKSLYPAITYWLALTTPNGAPASPIVVHRTLLKCGVNVTANRVTFAEGKECEAMKELYKVLKDHKNPFMEELVQCSYRSGFAKELESIGGAEILSSQELDECGTESVVRLTVVNPQFEAPLAGTIDKLVGAGLRVDKFGFAEASEVLEPSTSSGDSNAESRMLSDKLTVLINDIAISMKRLGYASYRGKVYKREPRSKYTYSYKCEARAFINTLATNEFFKSRLIREMKKVIDLLADPFGELFAPLTVDYDLIEVNNGCCWSIKRRDFVNGAIKEHQIGKLSPRAFCPFDPSRDPDPRYFREVLENSLEPQEVAEFCNDFLKLLSYNQKRHKDKVPCLVGDANSGKTSLFFPILGLIHHGNVATVTKRRAFNKSMITPFTEVIFIDEATETTLDIDDWKILTQGGYAAHDVKYQSARAFINRCPMLITSQRKLEFGPADQPAMDRRLRTYSFRSLPQPKRKASTWMKKHAMDCVLWAAQKAKASEEGEESESGSDSTVSESESPAAEGVLQEEDKGEIRSLSLPALLTEETPAADTTVEEIPDDEHGHDSNSGSPADRLQFLQGIIKQSQPGSLRYRHLKQILKMEERRQTEERQSREEELQRRKNLLRNKGVSSQHLNLLPVEPDEPLPSPIAKDLQRFNDAQEAAEKEVRCEKPRSAYAGGWLRTTEMELHECVEKIQRARDPYLRSNLQAYQETLSHKLKLHHVNLGTFNTEEAVEERRRVCTELGILSEQNQELVKNVTEPMPGPSQQQGLSRPETAPEDSSSDEEELFMTPLPSCTPLPASAVPSSVVDDCSISKDPLGIHSRKRPRHKPH